jgi:hypothetical protein
MGSVSVSSQQEFCRAGNMIALMSGRVCKSVKFRLGEPGHVFHLNTLRCVSRYCFGKKALDR